MKLSHLDLLRKGVVDFTALSNAGILEYLDRNEEKNAIISLYYTEKNFITTHLEIEPFSVLGIISGLIPYLEHNHSPRNTYQCAMGKQAAGNLAFNQLLRMDQTLHLLCYPQKPLLNTTITKLLAFDKLGGGQNAIVSVMSFSGYDIEDAIVINKSAIERGFGSSILYEKFVTMLKRYPNRTSDKLLMPTASCQKTRSFRQLDYDGLVLPGSVLHHGDLYIYKQVPINTKETINNSHIFSESFYNTVPLFLEKNHQYEKYAVEKVLLTTSQSENILIKILIRRKRSPVLGDKLSSRHGQKGTLGKIISQENLPFSERGIYADLIMNPHGFPSRMTVGKIIELIEAKAAAISGILSYEAAFTTFEGSKNVKKSAGSELVKTGFCHRGKEFMTCGLSGEPQEALVFMGPIYYQRLKHMVFDKIYGRSRGPRLALIRQPTEGRSRKGGLRIGEMERDCLIGYGGVSLIFERLMISSDHYSIDICSYCRIMAIGIQFLNVISVLSVNKKKEFRK